MRVANLKCELLSEIASENAGKKGGLKIPKRIAKMQDVSCKNESVK